MSLQKDSKQSEAGPLYIPALQCRMGDWTYYVASLPLAEIALRVTAHKENVPNDDLEELLQRELKADKVEMVADYLIRQDQRFFNSLIISIHRGAPQWLNLELGETPDLPANVPADMLTHINDSVGILLLTGNEELFAIDGQHRVEGIKKALYQKETLGSETMSVLFVGDDKDTGRERTRRMFTTLNRYATKVNQGEIIALDEDDVYAITTRRLLKENKLLTGARSSDRQAASLSVGSPHFTTPRNISKIIKILCEERYRDSIETGLTTVRPPERTVQAVYKDVNDFWTAMAKQFSPVSDVLGDDFELAVAKYRTTNGGHLLFRLVGQNVLARAVSSLCNEEPSLLNGDVPDISTAVKTLASIDDDRLQLDQKPWLDLFWNQQNASINAGDRNEILAARLWCFLIGKPMRLRIRSSRKFERDSLPRLEEDYIKLTGGNTTGLST